MIVPHANTDLDALGAAVGAQILYPKAIVTFPGLLLPGAAEFQALHRHQLRVRPVREVDVQSITHLIMVDTADPERLGALAAAVGRPGVPVHVYDHHPRGPLELPEELEVTAAVGACSTLVAELLAEGGAALTPFQATALLLGIYADTGNLTLPATTPRDVRAAAWLLEQGGNLRLVEQFVRTDLNPAQQELLAQLVASSRVRVVRGVKIRLAPGSTAGYVGGLAHVVQKLAELQPAPATFVAVRMGDRVHLVGRSEVPWVDAGAILGALGGGGHPAAGAAVIRAVGLEAAVARLEAALAAGVGRPVTARDLMTSPVRAVPPHLPAAEAERVMVRYGHGGLVVVADGQVVGVVSRRDCEKARRHGLEHAPVKGLMARPMTVPPSMPLDEVQGLLVGSDVSRLPVVEDGRLVGIITRSDVLGQLYGTTMPHWHHTLYRGEARPDAALAQAELVYRAAALPAPAAVVLRAAGQVARETAMPAYAVGGFIRDLLLQRPNLDIDVVVEGDGLLFAAVLAPRLGARMEPVPRFGTAHLFLPSGVRVDVATARREFYEYAAALPKVERGNLRDDLYRRDFSINAMAVRLTPAGLGDLEDFFGGYADLKAGLVRVLHSLSFVEDPTRILRAVRFASRYGLRLEPETERLAVAAAEGGFIERVSAERLRNELLLILQEEDVPACLGALMRLGALGRVLPEVVWGGDVAGWLALAHQFLAGRTPGGGPLSPALQSLRKQVEAPLLYTAVLGAAVPQQDVPAYVHRLRLRRKPAAVLLHILSGWRDALGALAAPGLRPSEVVAALEGWPPEGLALLWLLGRGGRAPDRVRAFWSVYRKVRPAITSKDLQAAGIPPGRAFGLALSAVKRARLDGRVRGREQELALALATVRELAPPAGAAKDQDSGPEL